MTEDQKNRLAGELRQYVGLTYAHEIVELVERVLNEPDAEVGPDEDSASE